MTLTPIDPLRLMAEALPPELRQDAETYRKVLTNYAKLAPDHMLGPISSADCAALLGKSPAALKTARARGQGPDGFAEIAGFGWCYPSRLHVLTWVADQMGIPTEPKEATQ